MDEKEQTQRPQEKEKITDFWYLYHPWLSLRGDEKSSSVDEEIRYSLDEIRMG